MKGLTTEFGMGSGDPLLYGSANSRYSFIKLAHPDICIGTKYLNDTSQDEQSQVKREIDAYKNVR